MTERKYRGVKRLLALVVVLMLSAFLSAGNAECHGIYLAGVDSADASGFAHRFYVRDHPGNNRMVIDGDGGVRQIQHYYPFGLSFEVRNFDAAAAVNRRSFGGKELDRVSGLDLYDQEARQYDPALLRFTRPDDLGYKFYPVSPFAFCLNNPMIHTDPTGKIVDTIWDVANVAADLGMAAYHYATGDTQSAKSDLKDAAWDTAAALIPGVPAGGSKVLKAFSKTESKVASSNLKNADKIKEGKEWGSHVLDSFKKKGNAEGEITLVPLNGKGNVKGNRTRVDVLIKNQDGTFTIVEAKLTNTTRKTTGQKNNATIYYKWRF